ncbi:complex I NDUFA9 subunit family protein [Methyloradius palustris]|uniref:Complex I NDUFA9 subunit family protein n=1 Tax=Methyloradius palustris TaxID=2778876 RepID=A0A8D5GA77_9PROT|nr:complex I NDUFA9 subunit family protein [Methyloradius palustris]BCM25881.1 complex I NDUFA9 subunit family protein [Methyloradius palustris]
MRIKDICVLGGSGFVGSALVHRLSAAGYNVKVLTRRREASKHLILLPYVQVIECDVMNDAALAQQVAGSDAVINLIGILHEDKNLTFKTIHTDLPIRLLGICERLGVCRFLHMSALQASVDAPSAYLRSKGAAEVALMAHQGNTQITIFRPSVIFGRGDGFINLFAKLVKLMPVIALAKPDAKFQPIWVEDVAQAFVSSLENIDTYGKQYDLGGPRIYSLKGIVQFVVFLLGKKRKIVGLNDKLSYLQAYALEKMPIKLMTRDNIYSMEVDSVTNGEFPKVFGFQPTALEAIVPDYLANDNPRNAYNKFRGLAGR